MYRLYPSGFNTLEMSPAVPDRRCPTPTVLFRQVSCFHWDKAGHPPYLHGSRLFKVKVLAVNGLRAVARILFEDEGVLE